MAKKTRASYSDEFKARAVKAATAPGVKVITVAKEMKVATPVLRRWIKEAGAGKAHKKNGKAHGPSVIRLLEGEEVKLEMALASIRETIRLLRTV